MSLTEYTHTRTLYMVFVYILFASHISNNTHFTCCFPLACLLCYVWLFTNENHTHAHNKIGFNIQSIPYDWHTQLSHFSYLIG